MKIAAPYNTTQKKELILRILHSGLTHNITKELKNRLPAIIIFKKGTITDINSSPSVRPARFTPYEMAYGQIQLPGAGISR